MTLGSLSFGNPTRITARIRLGRGEVVDIEREVALGGSAAFRGCLDPQRLSRRTVRQYPAAVAQCQPRLRAILWWGRWRQRLGRRTFRPAFGVADAPVSQSFAVTGSVDQL